MVELPTAGVPRTADGSPDLNAPAPRSVDGHPDPSGISDIEHNRPCPPEGCPDMQIGQEFLNFGWRFKDGLPYQPWAANLVKQRTEQYGKDDPTTLCLAAGLNGSPMTDAAKVTEIFRRVNYGKLEIEVTVDDPKAYTKPWTVKLSHFIVLDTELIDYICNENEKDVPRLIGSDCVA